MFKKAMTLLSVSFIALSAATASFATTTITNHSAGSIDYFLNGNKVDTVGPNGDSKVLSTDTTKSMCKWGLVSHPACSLSFSGAGGNANLVLSLVGLTLNIKVNGINGLSATFNGQAVSPNQTLTTGLGAANTLVIS